MENESGHVRALERGISVLFALESAGRPVALGELATAIGLSNATTLRMIATLEQYGLIEKSPAGFRLGVSVLPLTHGYLLGNELTLAALPVLQDLAMSTGEAVSLYVRFGFERIIIQRVDGPNALRYLYPAGQRLPLHVGVGKVLAAALSADELASFLDEVGETHFASGDPFSRDKFVAEMDVIRKQGFATSRNERVMGLASVAAPIVNSSGITIAAISVAGPSERMPAERFEILAVDIRRAAMAIADQCSVKGRPLNVQNRLKKSNYTM